MTTVSHDPAVDRASELVLRWLEHARRLAGTSVILLGSGARGTRTADSDIDVLLVADSVFSRSHEMPYHVQTMIMSRRQFVDRALAGDELPLWALSYGRVLADGDGWFRRMKRKKQVFPWPAWRPSWQRGQRKLRVALGALEAGDPAAAREEAVYGLSHLARAVLLRRHVLPASRPELAGQLRRVGHHDLADSLEALLSTRDLDETDLKAIASSATQTAAAA
jgi:hypothetical protein